MPMQRAGGYLRSQIGGLIGAVVLHAVLLLFILAPSPRRPPEAAPSAILQAALLMPVEREPDRARVVAIRPPKIQPLPTVILPSSIPVLPGSPEVAVPPATAAPDNAIHVLEQSLPPPKMFRISDDYVARIAGRVAAVKRYPLQARMMRLEGVVVVAFNLDRSGRLLSCRIARSSNIPELDREAARMLGAAAPFPAFPATMIEPEQVFEIPVDFSLHEVSR